MNNDVLLVPITVEQPNVEAQSDIVVYVPQAHKNKPGIVKEGDGVLVENGVVSLNRQTVEDMIDANKWVSYGFQQNLTDEEKGLARHNIGAGDNDFTGSYYDVTQKPHLKTDNTNSLDAGDEEINHTINLHKLAKTGSFDDLNDVPTDTINFAESERQKSKNLFDINKLVLDSGVITGNVITTHYQYNYSRNNLKDFADLEIGKTYILSLKTTSNADYIFLNGTNQIWRNEWTMTITQAMLDASIVIYGNRYELDGVESTTSEIMIEEGSVVTKYQPYNGAITHNGDAPVIFAESERQKSKNLFNINKLSFVTPNNISIDTSTGIITFNNQDNQSTGENTLKNFTDLEVGKTYTLSFNSTSTQQFIYLNGSGYLWYNGRPHTITQEELDAGVHMYGVYREVSTIKDIQIEEGSVVTKYQPYNGAIVHEKELNEQIETRELLYDNFNAIDLSSSTLTTLQEFFDLFSVDTSKTYVAGIGHLSGGSFKNVINNPTGFGNYTRCVIKYFASKTSTEFFKTFKLFAYDNRSNKVAVGYLWKNETYAVVFSDWQIIGG